MVLQSGVPPQWRYKPYFLAHIHNLLADQGLFLRERHRMSSQCEHVCRQNKRPYLDSGKFLPTEENSQNPE